MFKISVAIHKKTQKSICGFPPISIFALKIDLQIDFGYFQNDVIPQSLLSDMKILEYKEAG